MEFIWQYGMESVFRKETPPYSSYIGLAYRYGLFILVPYCLYQICVVGSGVRALKYKKYGQYGYFTVLLATACIFAWSGAECGKSVFPSLGVLFLSAAMALERQGLRKRRQLYREYSCLNT